MSWWKVIKMDSRKSIDGRPIDPGHRVFPVFIDPIEQETKFFTAVKFLPLCVIHVVLRTLFILVGVGVFCSTI